MCLLLLVSATTSATTEAYATDSTTNGNTPVDTTIATTEAYATDSTTNVNTPVDTTIDGSSETTKHPGKSTCALLVDLF